MKWLKQKEENLSLREKELEAREKLLRAKEQRILQMIEENSSDNKGRSPTNTLRLPLKNLTNQ